MSFEGGIPLIPPAAPDAPANQPGVHDAEDDDPQLQNKTAEPEEDTDPLAPSHYSPVVYYTNDPIQNLQIRIILHRQGDDDAISQKPLTSKGLQLYMKERQSREKMVQRKKDLAKKVFENDEMGKNKKQPGQDDRKPLLSRENDEEEEEEASDNEDGRRNMPNNMENGGNAEEQKEALLRKHLLGVFSWQNKVFSPREILSFCRDDVDTSKYLLRQYQAEICNMLQERYPAGNAMQAGGKNRWMKEAAAKYVTTFGGMSLATKVDMDGYVDPADKKKQVATFAHTNPHFSTPLGKQIVELAHHDKFSMSKSHLGRDDRYESFYVLGSLNIPTDDEELHSRKQIKEIGAKEMVLCRIRAYGNGTFDMRPGFSPEMKLADTLDPSEWYFVRDASGQSYRYRVECANVPKTEDGASVAAGRIGPDGEPILLSGDEKRMVNKLKSDKQKQLKAQMIARQEQDNLARVKRVGMEFTSAPPRDFFRLNLFGEIIKTSGFDDDYTFVEYRLCMPDAWMWSPNDVNHRTSAITQVGSAYICPLHNQVHVEKDTLAPRDERVCHVAHPFEMELLGRVENEYKAFNCKVPYEGTKTMTGPSRWPTLLVTVWSMDWLDCARVVGYGHMSVPQQPGCMEMEVKTWRPVGNLQAQLSSFYLGGGPRLRDEMDAGYPMDHASHVLNKYGMVSESSGSVHVRLDTVVTYRSESKNGPRNDDFGTRQWGGLATNVMGAVASRHRKDAIPDEWRTSRDPKIRSKRNWRVLKLKILELVRAISK